MPDFWNDNVKAQGMLKEKTQLEKQLQSFEAAQRKLDDAQTLIQLGDEMGDAASSDEGAALLSSVEAGIKQLEVEKML